MMRARQPDSEWSSMALTGRTMMSWPVRSSEPTQNRLGEVVAGEQTARLSWAFGKAGKREATACGARSGVAAVRRTAPSAVMLVSSVGKASSNCYCALLRCYSNSGSK